MKCLNRLALARPVSWRLLLCLAKGDAAGPVARDGGERFHVAALPLGVNGVGGASVNAPLRDGACRGIRQGAGVAMGKAIRAIAAVLAGAAAASLAAAGPTAEDHRGNRIESFRQTKYFGTREEYSQPNRNCTVDRRWCADLRREPTDRHLSLYIVAKGEFLPRRYRYELPIDQCCAGPGWSFSVWDEIVREPRGGALIGVVLGHQTGDRRSLWSYQRRLLLLRVPEEAGGVPVPVLEAPLSGVVEQPVCISAEDQKGRPHECIDRFYLDTLWTLVPSVASIEPADLIMVAEAITSPGRRTRPGGKPMLRAPVERTGNDRVRDPACTYTRSYYFDEALGRYLPDAPLPDCSDYLKP